ncbi:hypothetical protein FKM82_030004 [Ascaphus truei]
MSHLITKLGSDVSPPTDLSHFRCLWSSPCLSVTACPTGVSVTLSHGCPSLSSGWRFLTGRSHLTIQSYHPLRVLSIWVSSQPPFYPAIHLLFRV